MVVLREREREGGEYERERERFIRKQQHKRMVVLREIERERQRETERDMRMVVLRVTDREHAHSLSRTQTTHMRTCFSNVANSWPIGPTAPSPNLRYALSRAGRGSFDLCFQSFSRDGFNGISNSREFKSHYSPIYIYIYIYIYRCLREQYFCSVGKVYDIF